MADIYAVRRKQLALLVKERGGQNELARKLGLKKGAYLSQLLGDPPFRTLSEKNARKWEKILELGERWFDGPDAQFPVKALSAVNAKLLRQVIHAVAEALHRAKLTPPPAKLADLILIQYRDALAAGHVDQARVQQIVNLLKD